MAKKDNTPCNLDMTPMIDVTFQLIIFFIVTIKMNQDINTDIKLEYGKNGPTIEKINPTTLIVEIDKSGWISIHNARMTHDTFRNIMKNRYKRLGSFEIIIRGDLRAQHKEIRRVMDICTEVGIWRINFAALKEKKT